MSEAAGHPPDIAPPDLAAASESPAEAASPPRIALDLLLHPDDIARFARVPEIAALSAGRPRTTTLEIVWHDTPDAALAEMGLSLTEMRLGSQRLCRLKAAQRWPALQPAVVAEAATVAGLADALPAPLAAMAALQGQQRSFRLTPDAPVSGIELWSGTLRAVTAEHPAARLRLRGTPDAVFDLASALARPLRLSVGGASLAAEALALARPHSKPRPPAPPTLEPGLSVSEAFASVVGRLTAILLHHAPAAIAAAGPEPVHQMRVALRRLRSAMSLFARATWCAELDAARAQLRPVAAALGPARDWDVFTTGTGRAVGIAFADERAVTRLLAAAERQRLASYQTLRETLESAGFRILTVTLARLALARPWERVPDDEAMDAGRAGMLAMDLRHYAERALARRFRHVRAAGENAATLTLADLHALRIQCKRLRYAAEFFAPLFPGNNTRRFIRRLSALQERLGHLNDGAVASALVAALGSAAGERSLAAGVVRGFVAAQSGDVRADAERSWRKFQDNKPFWS